MRLLLFKKYDLYTVNKKELRFPWNAKIPRHLNDVFIFSLCQIGKINPNKILIIGKTMLMKSRQRGVGFPILFYLNCKY